MAASASLVRRHSAVNAVKLLSRQVQAFQTAARCTSSHPATGSGPIKKRNIQGFELSSHDPASSQNPRPLAVLIGWLNAKRRHLGKFQQLYWQRGFDVLTMDVSPVHVVLPQTGVRYTKRLLAVLQEDEELGSRKVVLHGFSIAAFIYTQLQLLLEQQQTELLKQQQPQLQQHMSCPDLSQIGLELGRGKDYISGENGSNPVLQSLGPRLAGVVLDSPTYMDYMCQGIADSITKNKAARQVIHRSLLLYLQALPKSVSFHYHESHRIFHHNTVPTLFFYSNADLVSSPVTSERYADVWRQKGVPVFLHKFKDTQHVSHFRHYPGEYTSALNMFIDRLDLSKPQPFDLRSAADVQ